MNRILTYVSQLLGEEGIINKNDIDTCRYGLEVFTTSILELLSVLVIALFLDNFVDTFLFFMAFIPLRIYAGGYHADSQLRCYLILLVVYGIFTLLINFISPEWITIAEISTMIITLPMILLYAPIINDKKSINEIEAVLFRKISIAIIIVEILVIIIGMILCPGNKYIFSFSLGQLAVSSSMIAAFVKNKLTGGEINGKI